MRLLEIYSNISAMHYFEWLTVPEMWQSRPKIKCMTLWNFSAITTISLTANFLKNWRHANFSFLKSIKSWIETNKATMRLQRNWTNIRKVKVKRWQRLRTVTSTNLKSRIFLMIGSIWPSRRSQRILKTMKNSTLDPSISSMLLSWKPENNSMKWLPP